MSFLIETILLLPKILNFHSKRHSVNMNIVYRESAINLTIFYSKLLYINHYYSSIILLLIY